VKKLLLTAAATLALIAPANATPVGIGDTTLDYVRKMDACGTEAMNEDFNKFRVAFDECLRNIDNLGLR